MRDKYITLISPDEAIEGQWQGLRVGSESCASLLPTSAVTEVMTKDSEGRSRVLVTPVCGPAEIEEVVAAADRVLCLGWGEVVVNDWGVLSRLAERWEGRLSAGRLVVRLRRGPGHSDPWERLDEESRRYFAWGGLYDSALLALVADMGVRRLEVDPPRHWLAMPTPEGFRFSFHGDHRLISLSGRCPWLYDAAVDRWSLPGQCRRGCLESGPLLMYAPHLSGPLIQWGREILEDASDAWSEEDLPPEVDRIIYSNMGKSGTVDAYNSK